MQALLEGKDGPGYRLGIEALSGMLRAANLSGHSQYSFSARVRDFGWWPVDEQFDGWYVAVLDWIAERVGGPLRELLRERVASALPGLCKQIGRPRIAQALTAGGVWPEAWVAMNTALRKIETHAGTGPTKAAGGAPEPQARACLEQIEALLRPARLADEVRAYAMTERWKLNFAAAQPLSGDAVTAKDSELDRYACELGQALTKRPDDLATLLPELLADKRPDRRTALGRGLSAGCTGGPQRWKLWDRMVDVFTTTTPERRNVDLLCGFLQRVTEHEPALAQELLDAAVIHPTLGQCLPALQVSVISQFDGAMVEFGDGQAGHPGR